MPKIIKDKQISDDQWQLLTLDSDDDLVTIAIPEGPVILPLPLWQAKREELIQRQHPLGILLQPENEPGEIAEDLSYFELIAINFPKFSDGRGYSSARELRTRYQFDKEIRAVGDVLRDQLYLMARCGFNAFAVREDRSIEDALNAFNDFSVNYQADALESAPLYRR